MNSNQSDIQHGTKRVLMEFSNEISPIPFKKQKQIQHITAIKNIKKQFTISKLQINKTNSIFIANDSLFNKQLCTKQSQYIRWVIACKFIIATGVQFDSYNCHGMHRNKIPQNMYFYVDNQKNLCALIYNTTQNNSISNNIITHCNKIETSLIETYYGMNDINLETYFFNFFQNENEFKIVNEDDDLWIDTQKPKHNYSNNICINNNIIINIIRIPKIYYSINFNLSFYWLCCRISKYIFNISKDFSHPLFQLFFKNIANFDCFMLSVPFIPLSGNIYEMFCEYCIGNYNFNEKGFKINEKEFKSFLGTYDCWCEILRKYKCRKSMHKYWNNITKTDINIMNIVIEYADLNKMSDGNIMKYIGQFYENNKIKYNKYFKQLKSQIPCLEQSIVKF